jgi:uncharacterized protein YukE
VAKKASKEEVTEDFTWEVSVTIVADSQEAIESAVEQIESNLDDVTDNLQGALAEDFSVRLS